LRRTTLAPACWLAAVAWAAWAVLDHRFRDVEGFPDASVVLPLAASAGSVLLALGARGGWLAAAGWLASALLGRACALQLLVAGPAVGYSYYWPFGEAGPEWAGMIGLVVQTALVAAGLGRWLGEGVRRTVRDLGPLRLALVAAAFVLTSSAFRAMLHGWAIQLGLASAVQLLQLLHLLLVARALPDGVLRRWRDRLERWTGPPGEAPTPGGLDRFAVAAAAWTLIVTAALNVLVYERHPHVPDEVVYLMHADYLAEGRLSLDAPPVPEAFDVDLMLLLDDERWVCPVQPAWPAALAVGAWLGAPSLVNPVLSALGVLLAYQLLRELFSRRTARLSILLLCASPWFLFMGMSYMTHCLVLAAATLAALGVARARRTGRASWAWAAGAGIGVVGLVRPLEGLALASLLGLWSLGLGGRRLRPAALVGLVTCAVLVAALSAPYNRALTGSPARFPIMVYADHVYGDQSNAIGFGSNRGLGWTGLDPYPGHGLVDVLVNTSFNASAVNAELGGWSVGSTLAIALALVGALRGRGERLMATVLLVVVAIHSLYYFSGGPDFGARYWYLALVPCVVLALRGVQLAGHLADGGGAVGDVGDAGAAGDGDTAGAEADAGDGDAASDEQRAGVGLGETRALAAAGALCLTALVTFVPWRAVDKYHHYRGMRPDVRELAEEHDFGRSLVLVQGERHPDYGSAAVYNPTDLEADAPIYAWDRDPAVRAALLDHYADRPVWILAGPSVTGGPFEVVEGPVPAGELARR